MKFICPKEATKYYGLPGNFDLAFWTCLPRVCKFFQKSNRDFFFVVTELL